jgi:hypothetical protein
MRKTTGFISAILILTVLAATMYALPALANPLREQTQQRDQDCQQTCDQCEGCDCNEYDQDHSYGYNYNHNYDYMNCGDCGCDGSMKQTRAGQQTY